MGLSCSRGARETPGPANPAPAMRRCSGSGSAPTGAPSSARSWLLARWPWCAGRSQRCSGGVRSKRQRVTFSAEVRVTEYSRELDGGCTIPGDGTRVTLGLGRAVGTVTVPLCGRRRDQRPVEDRAWVPSRERVRLMRASMGDACFYAKWGRCRWEISRTLKARRRSRKSWEDVEMMPRSLGEALQVARKLSKEARPLAAADLRALFNKKPFSASFGGKGFSKKTSPSSASPEVRAAASRKRPWRSMEEVKSFKRQVRRRAFKASGSLLHRDVPAFAGWSAAICPLM